mgnify:CR=1 FL=1
METNEFNPYRKRLIRKGIVSGETRGMYRQYLSEYVYDKIWSELSNKDKKICYGIAETDSGKIKEIREKLSLKTNEFNPYRDRLKKRGIINCEEHGYVHFALPEFGEYVLIHV